MKRVLTITEACRMLRVNRSTIWRWIQSGKLPAVKPGRDWRVCRDTVEAMLEGLDQESRQD